MSLIGHERKIQMKEGIGMIRFIDLGKQIGIDDDWPREFAFYNTVSDMFIDLGGSGCQTWESWTDFEEDWNLSTKDYPLERFKSLCQDWVFGQATPQRQD